MRFDAHTFRFSPRHDRGVYRQTVVHVWPDHGAKRTVEVCVSPTGRSIQVFVDGEKVA